MAAWLVVGLGNPGPQYARTRHNAGALVVELLAARAHGGLRSHHGVADVLVYRTGEEQVILARPRAYMNESGPATARLAAFYRVPAARLVAIHDELDLPFGAVRIKFGGGDNGHNGLRSLTRHLGGPDYHRVRLGIGRPPGREPAADFVLRPYPPASRDELDLQLERAGDAVECLVTRGLAAAQNAFNG